MIRFTLALLLIVPLTPALSDELRIDPARLQAQVQQHTEHAAMQGAAPTAAAEWVTAPAAEPSVGYGHAGQGDQGRGYGQGYERRYGGNSDHAGSGSAMSPLGNSMNQDAGGGQGLGGSSSGRGRR